MQDAPTGAPIENMTFNPDTHHRRSIRLKGYDYSQAGAYFVTICTYNKECLFGNIINSEMKWSAIGEIVQKGWFDIPEQFPNIQLDSFIVMPNHIHGIIVINHIVGAQFIAPNRGNALLQGKQGVMNHAPTIGNIMRAFKARCTYATNQTRNAPEIAVWQRNYYEHIIRSEPELHKIREYIVNNPLNWETDENYKD